MGSTMTTGEGSTGPNITSGVTWVTSDFFFFLIFFLKLINVYIVYIIVIYEIQEGRR